jgi:hypothetical protein
MDIINLWGFYIYGLARALADICDIIHINLELQVFI